MKPPVGECEIWQGRIDRDGYGRKGQGVLAHRVAYEAAFGPIPPGLHIDHLCHTASRDCAGGRGCLHRACVNPAHMEVVTLQENARRYGLRHTACSRGHEYTPENTRIDKFNRRFCRTCVAARSREYQARKRALKDAA